MATFSSPVKCFRPFLMRPLRYLNGRTPSPVPAEARQCHDTSNENRCDDMNTRNAVGNQPHVGVIVDVGVGPLCAKNRNNHALGKSRAEPAEKETQKDAA